MKRHLLAVGIFGTLTFGLGAATAVAAPIVPAGHPASNFQPMGWPTGCRDEVMNNTSTAAICADNNGGYYQAIAICKFKDTGQTAFFYGTWEGKGGLSTAYCQGYSYVDSSGINTTPTKP